MSAPVRTAEEIANHFSRLRKLGWPGNPWIPFRERSPAKGEATKVPEGRRSDEVVQSR